MSTTKKPVPFARHLKRLGACEEAVEWIGKRSLATAWRDCHRADWMLWLLAECDGWSRKALDRCNLDFMADALESARAKCSKEAYWPQVESAHRMVRAAIESGNGLDAALSAARSAASSAAWSAARSAASSAAWSAAWSAASSAAWSAARSAARSAADAAWSAADAAWSAADAAWSAAQSRFADIVRKHFPKPPKMRTSK